MTALGPDDEEDSGVNDLGWARVRRAARTAGPSQCAPGRARATAGRFTVFRASLPRYSAAAVAVQ